MGKSHSLKICFFIMMSLTACDRGHTANSEKNIAWLKVCPDFSVTGKAPVEVNAQCGQLQVLEKPQDPASVKISLNVLRLPAVNPAPEKDPLFIIAGGPGQSAVNIAESTRTLYGDVRKNRDIIFVDQRGTGQSNPFECDFPADDGSALNEIQQREKNKLAVQGCLTKYQNHIAFYTTPYAVDDIDAVRAELGYEKINLWGGSYGSRVVLEYLRRHPEQARSGVVDGVAPVEIALPWNMEVDGLQSLKKIGEQCAANANCQKAYGDIFEKAESVSHRLRDKAVDVVIQHPRTQEKVSVTLSSADFSSIIRLALYNREFSTLVPKVINDSFANDFQLLGSLIYMVKSRSDLKDINQMMHYVIACAEDYPLYKDKSWADSNVLFDTQMVQRYAEVCEQFPASELPKNYWEPMTSQVPVFILSGSVDPVTPPRWGDAIQQRLPQSTHIVASGGHHIISQEGCVPQLISAFIANASAKGLDTDCVKQIQPMPIFIPPVADEANKNKSKAKD